MAIKYKKQSLFDAPEGSILAHATNTEGIFGSGIAVEFKKRYPKSYLEYNKLCLEDDQIGRGYICEKQENGHVMACLFTSTIDSRKPNPEEVILLNSVLAIDELLSSIQGADVSIYSNKFNSGLFRVPWFKTEAILKTLTKRYNVTWIVADPDLDDNFDGFTYD